MKHLIVVLCAATLALAACTPTEQSTTVGALGGAALGAAVSGKGDKTKGAIAGAAVGALAGSLIGPASTPGQCRYNDGYGRTYLAPC
ncbi:MAG: YMGG-like glycine zipper-containing protein [Paracoccaceae bacterium]